MKELEIKFKSSDLHKTLTIRQYFKELLKAVWEEGEGFSGKRPFGNSGWEYEVYTALVKDGAVPGEIDEDGFLDTFDQTAMDKLIQKMIGAL